MYKIPLTALATLWTVSGMLSVAHAWSGQCALGLTECIFVQGNKIPINVAESMVSDCSDFTKNNIGHRVLQMSFTQIHGISGGRRSHPLLRGILAFDSLHDSPLAFNRNLPIEQKYLAIKRACGSVFKSMGTPPPGEDE